MADTTTFSEASGTLLRAVLNATTNGMVLMRAVRDDAQQLVDFEYILTNAEAERLLRNSNLVGQRALTLFPGLVASGLFTHFADVTTTGQPWKGELFYDYENITFWAEVSVVQIDSGCLVTFQDITERKQHEQERLAAANLIEGIFQASPWAVIYVTPIYQPDGRVSDFRFEMANQAAERVGGMPLDQLLGRGMNELYPGTRTHGLFDHYVRVLETGEPFETEILYTGEGRSIWSHIVAVKQGNGLVLTNADVSAHRQAEAALRQQTELLEGVLNTAAVPIGVYEALRDETGKIYDFQVVLFNRTALTTVPEPHDRLTEKTLRQISPHTEDIGIFRPAIEVVETGVPQQVTRDYDYIGKSFLTSISRYGQNGIVVVAIDITLTREYQREAEHNAQMLQAVLDGSPASIAFLEAMREDGSLTDFCLVVCNRRFAEQQQRPLEQLTNQRICELFPDVRVNGTFVRYAHVVETGVPFYEEAYNETTGRWTAVNATKQDDGLVLTGIDITLLKEAEQQRDRWMTDLRHSAEAVQTLATMKNVVRQRSELLRAASHDLRASFGVIRGATDLLNLTGSHAERSEMLAMLQRNLRQATQMLTELMDLARLESGQEVRQISPFDAAELLAGLAESIRPLANERQLALQTNGPALLLVEGDAVKVRRIAQNLLLNALKYTKIGTITLCWQALDAERWQFMVSDTGPGFSAEQPHHGEGIGLTIVRHLCDLLGGELSLDTHPGTGSRASITLPRHYADT